MKRFTAMILCMMMVLSLCACNIQSDTNNSTPVWTEPPVVTLPDGSVVYSEEAFVEYPQTGEYKETALLTNVPGQRLPLLLDMRKDGTIDYLFADVEKIIDFQSFVENGAGYYTIAPDGTATKQDNGWMMELDRYMTETQEASSVSDGQWRFCFAAEEGTLLILAQYHNKYYKMNVKKNASSSHGGGGIQHSALMKVSNGELSVIPIDWEAPGLKEFPQLDRVYIRHLQLQDEQIMLKFPSNDYSTVETIVVTYQMDGTLVDVTQRNTQPFEYGGAMRGMTTHSGKDIPVIHENMIYYSLDEAWDITYKPVTQYTEDDSLYYIGKFRSEVYEGYESQPNLKMIDYGENGDFCCWFDEAGQGLLMRYTHNLEGKSDPEIVTVWSLEPIEIIESAVAQWNHTHASPIFRYETAAEELANSNLTQEEIINRLNLELLNNQGPDVMILDGLNVDKYLEFMTPLDQVNTSGVYDSILDRFSVRKNLLALPARVHPYLLGRRTEGTETVESLEQFAEMVTTSTEVLDIGKHGAAQANYNAMYYVTNYVQLFKLWYPAWADAIWENGKLNKEVFKEFLTQTNRLSEHYTLNWHTNSMNYQRPDLYSFEQWEEAGYLDFSPSISSTDNVTNSNYKFAIPYTLAAPSYPGLQVYWLCRDNVRKDTQSIPHYLESIPGPDGSGTMVPAVITGVRAGGNEAAGQEFVQILLSRDLQQGLAYYSPTLADGYPVRWSDTAALMEHMEEHVGQTFVLENSLEETLSSLHTTVIDEYLYKMTLDTARQFYRGAPTQEELDAGYEWEPISLDEAVELLEERTRIYLAELR